MGIYNNIILNSFKYNMATEVKGYTYPFPTLSKYLDYIKPGEYITVGGRPMSGKKSFIDYTYLINLYQQWIEQPEEDRPPLKIFYFSLKGDSLKKKLERWLCTYAKIAHSVIIDTSTLNRNSLGKMFDLGETEIVDGKEVFVYEDVHNAIYESEEFFDSMFDEGVLEYKSGSMSPTDIYRTVEQYMKKVGTVTKSGQNSVYKLKKDFENLNVVVIIDDVGGIQAEMGDFAMLGEQDLFKKLNENIKHLTKLYGATVVAGVPSKASTSRNPADSEPNYKELGMFGTAANKAIILYNPYNEGQSVYRGHTVGDYDIGEYNKLRTVFLARNDAGVSNVEKAMFFLQGPGYFAELSSDKAKCAQTVESLQLLAKEYPI